MRTQTINPGSGKKEIIKMRIKRKKEIEIEKQYIKSTKPKVISLKR